MDDLVAFVEARLAEDEQMAREAADSDSGEWFVGRKWNVYKVEQHVLYDLDPEPTNELVVYGNAVMWSEHIASHDPARVLRDVEAKRQILRAYLAADDHGHVDLASFSSCSDSCAKDALGAVLRVLSSAWREHPDFRPEWNTEEAGTDAVEL